MKTLNNFIQESLESDNLLWLLDQWFSTRQEEEQEFINIILQCQADNTPNNIETYINQTSYFKDNYKSFINFILDEVNIPKDIDYIYQMKNLSKILIGNKSNKNKYIQK